MNIYGYIDEYGIYSFNEKPFNDVDAVLFSFLSYANLRQILDSNKKKYTVREVGRMHLGIFPGKDKNIFAVKEANNLLRYIKDTKRYKDCILYNCEFMRNNDVQFGAVSIEYMKNKVFVSFEGTNELISGWIEDFILSYDCPTLSHEMAIDYLNRHFKFSFKDIKVGGHSKGGNLALVASMYADFLVRFNISQVYNVDGPGLLDEEFNSREFKRLLHKYKHIIPDYSFVGLFLKNDCQYVVKSTDKTLMAHNIVYWTIKGNKFVSSKLSPLAIELKKELNEWLETYSAEDKEAFIKNIDVVLENADVDSLLDFKESMKSILNVIKESKDISDDSRKILFDFFTIVVQCVKNVTVGEIKKVLRRNIKFGERK